MFASLHELLGAVHLIALLDGAPWLAWGEPLDELVDVHMRLRAKGELLCYAVDVSKDRVCLSLPA